jgi:4-coumarate--CoA ligase
MPQIAEACVVGVPHERSGEVPKAFVVRSDGFCRAVVVGRAHPATRLAPFKMPEEVVFLESIPKSASGKMLRRLLIEPVEASG